MTGRAQLRLAAGADDPVTALRLALDAVHALRLEAERWRRTGDVVRVLALAECPLRTREVARSLGLDVADARRKLADAHAAYRVRRFGTGPATTWAVRS